MIDMEKLKFDEKGLIPAIVVDGKSGQVLTLAYMNRESLEISIKEERTCFWSRSRQELWRKGETSGAVQHIIDITADCDYDALVIRVNKDGPACHTGAESCFHNPLFESEENTAFSLEGLMDMLRGRKESPKEGSYTSYLFDKGIDKILKKVECSLDRSNTVFGRYMCQGKMPLSVRQRYEGMKKQPIHLPNLDALIENFDNALSHPDAEDLERLKQSVK